jgi:hypothetical protein
MGRPKGQRHVHGPQVATPAQIAARRKNLLPGGHNKGQRKGEKLAAAKRDMHERVQRMSILDFAAAVNWSFVGRPGQELVLRLMYGLPLPEGMVKTYVRKPCDGFVLEERTITWLEYYTLLTGNRTVFERGQIPTEVRLCVGARSGKSSITSLASDYEATREKWIPYLRKNETAYAGIIATNLEQARDIVQQSCHDILAGSELSCLIADVGKRQIKLTNGLGIRSFPCNTRACRGFPYFFTCYDECAWYFTEGARADEEVHAAMNPRRLQFPGSKHMSITTPAGKQGRFYGLMQQGFQVHGCLTIKAPTWTFRPELVETGYETLLADFTANPFQFNREYGAEFDEVVTPFLPEKETELCMSLAGDLPPDPSIQYFMGIDASGLSGNDRFGLGICGKDVDRNRYVVAIERSYPDKDPDPIMADVAELGKRYKVRYVFTDRYAKGWVHAAIRGKAMEPILCPDAATVWTNFRNQITAKKVDLPDTKSLCSGLKSTQAAYSSSNRLSITRRRDRNGHGDEAEAIARAVFGACQETYYGQRQTEEDRDAAARQEQAEKDYDPLTYGRN